MYITLYKTIKYSVIYKLHNYKMFHMKCIHKLSNNNHCKYIAMKYIENVYSVIIFNY